MADNKHTRGGVRTGAGRPKMAKRDLQKTHSLRATDKDWKEIQIAARVIKACKSKDKRPRIYNVSKEEDAAISSMLIEGWLDKRHEERWGPETNAPETPITPIKTTPISVKVPETVEENEAVSLFLQLYRLNPPEASSVVQSHLDRELRIQESKRLREEQELAMQQIETDSQKIFDDVDELNARLEKMLGTIKS